MPTPSACTDGGRETTTVDLSLGSGHGRLWLRLAEPRPLTAEEHEFVVAVARQTALALERARLFEETRNVARTLQRSIASVDPPRDARYEVATLYQPADEHLEVGGDWYDAFTLPGGSVGIVVGDVVGRGLAAASAMGQLRSAVRALAGAGMGPEAVTRHLDTFVAQAEATQYATLAYAEVDPDTGLVTFAAAGHLPPVLIGPGVEPRLFQGGRSTPLGITTPRCRAPRTRSSSRRAPAS